jgi:hypothetical protein
VIRARPFSHTVECPVQIAEQGLNPRGDHDRSASPPSRRFQSTFVRVRSTQPYGNAQSYNGADRLNPGGSVRRPKPIRKVKRKTDNGAYKACDSERHHALKPRTLHV